VRYEILRTVFDRQAGLKIPFQIIQQDAAIAWERVDLTGLDRAAQESALRHRFEASVAGLDLERGPVHVRRLGNERRRDMRAAASEARAN